MKKVRIGAVINATQKPSREFLVGLERSMHEHLGESTSVELKFFLGSASTTVENLTEFLSSGLDVAVFSGMEHELTFRILKSMQKRPPAVFAEYAPFTELEWQTIGEGAVVVFDNAEVGVRAADFFLAHGLNNFAFVSRAGYREDVTGAIRQKAFVDRIREVRGDDATFAVHTIGKFASNEDYWESNPEITGKWLEDLPCPCGIFVNGEYLAFRIVNGCTKHGVPVPDRFEILGIDNNGGCCDKAVPAISAIKPGLDKFVAKTVEVALSLAKNPKMGKSRICETVASSTISERGSTAIGRGYGRISVRAKEFIRANACKGISVLSVAKALGVSRRTLEIRVREATGKSVHTLITNVKLDEVCRLLKDTDLPISEVVTRSGYSLTTNAFVLFKKTFGMTMRAYRRLCRPQKKPLAV